MESWPKNFKASTILDTKERGYTRLINAIIRSKDLSFGEKIVFSVLLSHAFDFEQCHIKHRTLAEECGCSVSTIKRYLKILRNKGALRWKKAGFGRCNQYFINPTIYELIRKTIQVAVPLNETTIEPSIRSAIAHQSDRRQANEYKTTKENNPLKTTSNTSKSKSYINYDEPLGESVLENQALFLAQRLEEAGSLPKYRHTVKRYKVSTIDKAFGYAMDRKADHGIEKNLAACFWAALQSIGGEGDK